MRRLHADGCTESYTGSISGGPQRKYYRITAAGRVQLAEMTEMWRATVQAVRQIGVL